MSNLVSFSCDGCQATLSIPVEKAGITGPCPYCGKQLTSPMPPVIEEVVTETGRNESYEMGSGQPQGWTPYDQGWTPGGRKMAPPEPVMEGTAPRLWLQPHLVARGDRELSAESGHPRLRIALIAAGFVVFIAGVGAAWKFWDASKPAAVTKKEEPFVSVFPVVPRPEVLAAADEPPPEIPDASDSIPVATHGGTLASPHGAVARNVSATSPAPVTPDRNGTVLDPKSTTAGKSESPGGPQTRPPANQPPAVMSAAEKQIREVVPADGHLEKPGNALIRFFAASTWQERLKYTLVPEKMKPLMEAHYKVFAEGPIIPEDIELTRIEATEDDPKKKYYAFIVYLPGLETGLPISVEDTKNGCLVEWISFIEAKERLLKKFYSAFRAEPGTFRVLARRCHYFDKDVPNQERKECFEIRPPDGSEVFHVWADKDSVTYLRHFASGERARWDVSSMMVLSLQWEKADGGAQYVRIRDVAADSWHPDLLPPVSAKK